MPVPTSNSISQLSLLCGEETLTMYTHTLTPTHARNTDVHQECTGTKNTLLTDLCAYFALQGPPAFSM